MRFAFSLEQQALRDAVRDLLGRACPPAVVRAAWGADDDAAPALWPQLARMGVVGMTAPERWGGLGLGELELVGVLEEAGHAALPAPLLETTAVAIPLLAALPDGPVVDGVRDRWLGAAAAGRAVIAVGLAGAPFVADAARAALLLLERDGELHAVPRDAAWLTAEASVDGARRLAWVDWTPSAATRVATGDVARDAAARALDRGAVAAAAELCGLGRRMIELTVDHVQVRHQFGRAIGSFQAVKHHLADAHAALELARPCVARAAYALAHDEPGTAVHASLAKAHAGDAARRAGRAALQCHGAIGYSFEHDLHLFMKRAWALAAAWGDAAWHRARIATAVLDHDAAPGAFHA
ncbi:MAG: acyl-CoA dehydrogenase family protein [Kofleriaceae bacterium]|nr:acyl-CoA dehydrogenase family protein [Kofleriaceae bacterium]